MGQKGPSAGRCAPPRDQIRFDLFQMEINTARSRKASYFNYKGYTSVAQVSGKIKPGARLVSSARGIAAPASPVVPAKIGAVAGHMARFCDCAHRELTTEVRPHIHLLSDAPAL
jgi:hypothetical protein